MLWRLHIRSLPGVLFGILVLLLALGNCWLGFYPYGAAVWIRPLLSLVGVVGAICLFCGSGWWRILLPAWCLLQTWVIATDRSGAWFYQGIMLGSHSESTTSMNDMVVEHSARGFNLAGLILLGLLLAGAYFRMHPPVRHPLSFKVVAIVLGMIAALGIWAGLQHWRQRSATFVLDLDLPRMRIYYKDRMLGRTPLRITSEKIREWQLPLDSSQSLTLDGSGWADGVILSDGKARLPLYAAVPWPFSRDIESFDSPWGQRCRVHVGRSDGNLRQGFAYPGVSLRPGPILNISLRDKSPLKAGSPLRLHCALTSASSDIHGRKTTIGLVCHNFERWDRSGWTNQNGGTRHEITMPVSWNTLARGKALAEDIEFDAPTVPGDYEIFCNWFLYEAGTDSNTGAGSAYSNIIWLQVQ